MGIPGLVPMARPVSVLMGTQVSAPPQVPAVTGAMAGLGAVALVAVMADPAAVALVVVPVAAATRLAYGRIQQQEEARL